MTETVEPRFAPGDCEHVAAQHPVVPSADGCEDCLRDGTRWVHLRLCMECGHMGCCDSSPQRHARAHWHAAEHPIVRSAERGEDWGYCFEHDLMLRPA